MSALDTVVNHVAQEINALPRGNYDEAILDPRLFANVPPLEHFLSPGLDVPQNPEQERELRAMIDRRHLLGMYVPMQSPGRVILGRQALRDFFWSLVHRLYSALPYITHADLERSLRVVVTKTYAHELFHFHSDVLRRLFSAPFDPLLEEALAVAWSRLQILQQRSHGNTRIGQMSGVVFNRLLPLAYDYRSPGYRDWPLYADEARFKTALLNYIAPPNQAFLQSNGVDMDALIFGMLGGISGGYVERAM